MIWLGARRGYLTDWVTQQWLRTTGRDIRVADDAWLQGPAGSTRRIGTDFFAQLAQTGGFEVVEGGSAGLLQDFASLSAIPGDLECLAKPVRDFYERPAAYELDAWSEWSPLFRPFGWALAWIFSRRLQQLNVPLSPLDSAMGMSSRVVQFRDPQSGRVVQTAWIRELHATGNVLYAGCYGVCTPPEFARPCMKVVFPLPNGNAVIIMKPQVHEDGSLTLTSAGGGFGDPGFYFVVYDENGNGWARYVSSMKETIHVYPAEHDTLRTDHRLRIWGREFLRLHYRMRLISARVTA